ncbi:dTMP kinase [Nocardioidaceae bacterium]|nr:dTMP kinase [Nocardioidaceae bacterium]
MPGRYAETGVFIALEGGEGTGKSTQSRALAEALAARGHEVVLTREPGDTPVGAQVRSLLLDTATGEMSPRTEALLYAADKAEHVDTLVLPALERGAVVVTDRYVDSTLAYQGAGRVLDVAEVESVARWATRDLRPHLTVLLDLDPAAAFARFEGRDRIESAGARFHERVREGFRRLAAQDPDRYLVLDAAADPAQITARVLARLEPLLAGAVRHGVSS